MTREDVIKKARSIAEKADVSKVDFIAVQVNLTDCDPGVFYCEIKDHKISIEPYEYIDRSCAVSIKAEDFISLITGKLDPEKAYDQKKLTVEGDLGKALEFSRLMK